MNSTEIPSADIQQKLKTRLARGAAIVTMAIAFALAAAMSWGKWGDLLIDATVDFDDARALLEPGHHLYVNPLYPYGPLMPYFNALLFKVFGMNSWVLYSAGLCAAALMTALIYRTARLFIGRLGSVTAAVAFIFICGFAKLSPNGSFNWVLSYRSAAQDGALVAMASAFFLIRHTMKQRASDFLLSTFFLAIAALIKIESITAATAPHLVFIVCMLWARRFNWRLYLSGYAASVALVLGVYGYFYHVAGPSLFTDNLFQLAVSPIYMLFATRTLGTDHFAQSLLEIMISVLYLLGLCAIPLLIHSLLKRLPDASVTIVKALDVLAGVGAFALFFSESLETAYRFVPFLALLMLIRLALPVLKNKELRSTNLPLMLLWTFVLGSLCRVLFKTVSYHYGFYLLPAGLAAVMIFFVKVLPEAVPRGVHFRRLCVCTAVGLFSGSIVHHLQYSIPAYAERTAEIRTPRGSMLIPAGQVMEYNGEKMWAPTGEYFRDLVAFLSALPRDSRVLIVPHGEGGLTFLTGLDNSYRSYVSVVPTLHGRYDDDEFLAEVKAHPPDYIIRIAMDLSEYGYASFGLSYSKKTWEWLAPQYEVFKSYPPRYIMVLKRKVDAPK